MHKRLAIGLLAAIVVVGLVVARRHELLRFTIERGASLGSGYAVRVDRMHVGWSAAAFWGVRMRRDGLPVLDADYVALHYSLRDLLPGSTHRFGLLGAELSGARVTLTRFRDGTFNLSLPQSGPAVPLPERTNPVPLHFSLRVRGLQLELREPAAFEESAKTVRVRDVSADGNGHASAFIDVAVQVNLGERCGKIAAGQSAKNGQGSKGFVPRPDPAFRFEVKRIKKGEPAVGLSGFNAGFPAPIIGTVRFVQLLLRETKRLQVRAGQRIEREHQAGCALDFLPIGDQSGA